MVSETADNMNTTRLSKETGTEIKIASFIDTSLSSSCDGHKESFGQVWHKNITFSKDFGIFS